MPYGSLAQYVVMAVVGASLLYWSEASSRALAAWCSRLMNKYPTMKKLPGTSEEFNHKNSMICVCFSGAILLACGVTLSFAIFLLHFMLRLHFFQYHHVTVQTVMEFVIGTIAVLFLTFYRYSRDRLGRAEAKNPFDAQRFSS